MEKEVDYTDKEIQFTLKGYVAKKMSERLDKSHPFINSLICINLKKERT